MATSETAKLLASLELKDKFSPTLKNANRALGQFDTKLSKTEGRAFRAGQQIGTGFRNVGKLAIAGMGVVAANVALGLDSLIKLEQQTTQTEAVIKSTGGAADVSAKDVRTLAESYEALNAQMGDEVIQSGANLLLTFTNIQKNAFEPALKTALDMNTALGKGPDGLTGTVKVLGKALNDPTKGLSALSRVGITFSKEQQQRIKDLQKEGKLYEAQTIILAELDKRFGGSFLAQGGTTAGKVAKFTDSIEDLQRALATALLPAIGNIADAFTELLADPQVIKGAEDLGREIGKLFSKENIKTGAKAIGDLFALIRDAAPAISSALGTIGTVLSTAFKAFTSLPKEVQALLIGGVAVNKLTGGLVTNIAGGIFGALKAMTVQAAVVNVNGGVVNGGGIPGKAGAGGLLGAGATVGSLVLPAAVIAAVSGAAVAEVNKQMQTVGFEGKFENPFGGGLLNFGQNVSNLATLIPQFVDAITGATDDPPARDTNISDPRDRRGPATPTISDPRDSRPIEKKLEVVHTALENQRKEEQVGRAVMSQKQAAIALMVQRQGERQTASVRDSKIVLAAKAAETARKAAEAGRASANASTTGANRTVAAINAIPAPVVNVRVSQTVSVSSVIKKTTVVKRYGTANGSRNQDGNAGSGDPRL